MSAFNQNILKGFVFLSITLLVFILSRNIGMFWDNVLFASKMGNHLYQNGLFAINIPIEFDPGHPPFLAFIMALGWKLFEYSLTTSHLMMAPFIFGLLWQLYALTGYFFEKHIFRITAIIILLADPTLGAHLILVNPQIIQLFFFFMVVNAILKNKTALKIIGLTFLGIVTFRGMMLCAGLFFFDLSKYLIDKQKLTSFFTRKRILEYLIGSIPAVTYVIWRLVTKGWLQSHPDSPWSACWQLATFHDFLRNIVVLVHRFVDFGRISVFFFLFAIAAFKPSLYKDNNVLIMLLLAITSVIVIIVVSLAAVNPMGHRYFIPSYLSFIFLAYLILLKLPKFKWGIYSTLLILLITGNLWIYPDSIAQGWDSSLAFTPYFKIRKQAIEYMDQKNIPIEETGTFFPNSTKLNNIGLNGDQRSFHYFTAEDEFSFYSNVYNLTDKDLETLKTNYTPVKIFTKNRIRLIIYQKICN